MRRYLLDTHIWLWYAAGSSDLPRSLKEALDVLGNCWLSPVSLWEAAMLAEKGRIKPAGRMSDWIDLYLERAPMREATFNFEIAKLVNTLKLPHNDPADRFIAATTLVYDLTLVTMDRHLVGADWLPTLTQ